MTRILLILLLALAECHWAQAQRFTDYLDRGLVAVPTSSTNGSTTNFISWRRLADEYYDVTYNLYKDGTLLAQGMTTTSYDDNSNGLPDTEYHVAAVVRGVEQEKCAAVKPWAQYFYNYTVPCPTGFLDIALAPVYDRNGTDVTANYEANDAEMADLDGDGDLEIIIKRLNTWDATGVNTGVKDKKGNDIYNIYPQSSTQFVVLDAYNVNWQTGAASLMWRIDCGPNMVSTNSTEINIIAYNWDEVGGAEVVLRGADNMIVYGSDGHTPLYTIGDMNVNTRQVWPSSRESDGVSLSSMAYTNTGAEYLIYMNGQTGELYQMMDYPLKRLEIGETDLAAAWGDGYGHRSSKYFFGAPFLDGREANLFLARGIYTRHKMMALNLDKENHLWSTRWTWNCNDSSSPWYGNGYHNFVIADVDEDGRDEIVYGSMVIDDNGNGLSTTGLGHGDAQHVSDFDPYRRGLEFFGCNEDKPAMNYRNATTSQLYVRTTADGDDGRALMANFSNSYPGSLGRSATSGLYSSVSDQTVDALGAYIAWGDLNFRIYFDGDLCSELLNGTGNSNGNARIDKPGTGRLFTSDGCHMNNGTKNNVCFQGDIIGDWREEIVVRCDQGLRVYTTGMSTSYSMPSLWFDHQYRQAMVWQMMAYNQPPHLSYFLGEMEGITQAPPPLTNRGRQEVSDHSTIGTTNAHLLMAATEDMTVNVSDGAAPYLLTVNTPTWVQGDNNNDRITTTTYTHTLTGGAFTGSMRLVKQGSGTLVLPTVTETYTGATDVWGGTLCFDGTLESSPLWLNRFTTLLSNGGTFGGGITADYGSAIIPGGENSKGSINTTTLTLNHGARIVLDVYTDFTADQVNASTLTINKKSGGIWTQHGPQYLKPVIQIVAHGGTLPDGTYDLGAIERIVGYISDIQLEGTDGRLSYTDGHISLVIGEGELMSCPEPGISEDGYETSDEGILLPAVGIVPTSFTYNGSSVAPSLTATFTDVQGTTTEADIVKRFYQEDYEQTTTVNGWTSPETNMSIANDNDAHGNYFYVNTGGTNTRYAYQMLTGVNVSDVSAYYIEFDLAVGPGNTDPVEFCVMSKNGIMPRNNWDNYATINNNANMLFDITAPKNASTYTVNGNTATTTDLSAGIWYHYTLLVDRTARTVAWSISNGSSGTFELPSGTSADVAGFYLVAGRYNSTFKLDNIAIYSAGISSYTFTRPGTLTVTAAYDGCVSTSTTYNANFVGVKIGSAGYATLGCRYPLNMSGADVEAYIVTHQNASTLSLELVTAVPAETGLLLKGSQGVHRLPITTEQPQTPAQLLRAVVNAEGYTVASDDIYVLATKNSGTGFYRCAQGVKVPAGKAYAQLTDMARECYFFDNSDGIANVQSSSVNVESHYDLQGRKLKTPSQRAKVIILNNKKIIAK